jgi:hypothetical protein
MAHVYVTVTGYGKRIVPADSPCEFMIEADGALRVTATASTPCTVRRISRDAPADLGREPDPVADVIDGPAPREWWLDAGPYALPLPHDWTALITGETQPAFYLVQHPDRAMFVQTARNRPTIESLVTPDQSIVDRGADQFAERIEVSYDHEGRRWLQCHALMRASPPTVVTVQSPAESFADARAAQLMLVQRLAFPAPRP